MVVVPEGLQKAYVSMARGQAVLGGKQEAVDLGRMATVPTLAGVEINQVNPS